MRDATQQPGYPLQPFEVRLAELETSAVDARRLAFTVRVGGEPTHQFYFDRFAKLVRDGASGGRALVELAVDVRDGHRGEAHNYLTHGLHSYKGKFFPQLVRSLLNHAEAGPGSVVVDPFVGSGTTTLEAALLGATGVGIDRNPLAAVIARTKLDLLRLTAGEVLKARDAIVARVGAAASQDLPNREYLVRWFKPDVLEVVARILGAVDEADAPRPMKDLARLALSNHLRAWSLQEPTQLRIFRRPDSPSGAALLRRFCGQLDDFAACAAIGVRLVEELGIALPEARISAGDSRDRTAWPDGAATVDAVVTSPPYATALPYIDTDRLSIFCLGLAEVSTRSSLEWDMVGTREILTRPRRQLEQALAENAASLPAVVVADIRAIKAANERVEVGFRRRNLPALLYRYFVDMQVVIERAARALRRGGLLAMVVGDSHTVAGGERMRIRTCDFLCAIAADAGLDCLERIPMGGQASYLPHQRNGIPHEEILLFRRRSEV